MPEKYKIEKTRDGQYYFNLIAPNNVIIITSEIYTTKQKCENGINAVKKYASNALIEDTTI